VRRPNQAVKIHFVGVHSVIPGESWAGTVRLSHSSEATG
jgi:hypothetical protein